MADKVLDRWVKLAGRWYHLVVLAGGDLFIDGRLT